MSVDFTDLENGAFPNSWSKGNGTVDGQTGNEPTVGGLFPIVRTGFGVGGGYVANSEDGYINFDGNGYYPTTNNVGFTNASKQTFVLDYKDLTLNRNSIFFSSYDSPTHTWWVYVDDSNKVRFQVVNTAYVRGVVTNESVNASSVIIARKDGADMTVWIDGVEATYSLEAGYNHNDQTYTDNMSMGYYSASSPSQPICKMYYMMNFNRAWSDAEIVAYSALGDDLGLIGNNVGDDLTLTAAPGYVSQNKMDIGIGIGI